jgi:hypothetical protein
MLQSIFFNLNSKSLGFLYSNWALNTLLPKLAFSTFMDLSPLNSKDFGSSQAIKVKMKKKTKHPFLSIV